MRKTASSVALLLAVAAFTLLMPLVSIGAPVAAPIVIHDPIAPTAAPAQAAGLLSVMLELAEPAGAAGAAQLAATESDLVARLGAMGVPVLFQARAAYRGVAVAAPAAQLEALGALPGVAGVHVIPPKQRSATSAADAVGAVQYWSSLGAGALGQGVRIGLIDSGVDYTHATFGGAGTPAAYTANNPAVVEPGSFPTTKVTGGRDFVGDAYDASGVHGSPTPAGDADPLDCSGHGTHVASVAAGYGVDASGATFHGAYGSAALASFQTPPGIAPEASVIALKIFGCRGDSTFLTEAIDYAIDPNGDGDTADRLVDALSISLGSPFGGASDPDAVAVDRAVRAGVVVVVAAGGAGSSSAAASGDVFASVSSPATSPLAIAVGAADTSATGSPVAVFSPRGPAGSALKPDLLAPGVAVQGAAVGAGSASTALSGTSVAAPQVAAAAALLIQQHPSWPPARVKAALLASASPASIAGALAPPSLGGAGMLNLASLADLDLLVYPSGEPGAALTFGMQTLSATTTLRRDLTIENIGELPRVVRLDTVVSASEPGVHVNLPAAPVSLLPGQSAQVPISVTVQPELLENTPDAATTLQQSAGLYRYYLAEHGGYVRATSSLGSRARVAYAGIPCDVDVWISGRQTAPARCGGVGDYVALGDGPQQLEIRPAGAAASATPLLSAPIPVTPGSDHTLIVWGPAGNLRLTTLVEAIRFPGAGRALVTFHNADPFGDGSPLDVYLYGEPVVRNLAVGELARESVAAGVGSFQVARAGASGERLTVRSGRVWPEEQYLLSAGIFPIWMTHSDNRFSEPPSQQVRVPFQIFPRSASASSAGAASYTVPAAATSFSVPLVNTGARGAPLNATAPRAQVALVSAFALDPLGESPVSPTIAPELRFADIADIGTTTNVAGTGDPGSPGTYVYFGIASHAAWMTPNQVQFRVYIDSTLDGTPDYVVVNSSRGALSVALPNSAPPDDVFISALYRILPGQATEYTGERANWNTLAAPTSPGLATSGVDPVAFNARSLFLVARASSLGLTAAQPRLRYYVESRVPAASSTSLLVDRVPATGYIEYDLTASAAAPMNLTDLALVDRPVFVGSGGGAVALTVNQAVLSERGSQRVMLLHHHNAPAAQVEVITLQSSTPLGLRADPENVRALLPMIESGPAASLPSVGAR